MANTRGANVLRVDSSAGFADAKSIKAVKYIGNTSGTANIRAEASASGSILWEADGTADIFEEPYINDKQGVYVTVTNGAVVYIYLK